MWTVGTKLLNQTNPELGVGIVVSVDGRFADVSFPDADRTVRYSADAVGLREVVLGVGDDVRLPDGAVVRIESVTRNIASLSNGRVADLGELWPHFRLETPLDRLAAGVVDPFLDVLNRYDGIRLLNYRRRGELASLVGGRVELFAHQLSTAARAIGDERVRWLLADEVGLGKTVVACMITSALIRMGRVEKVVVVAPRTLTIQWLGELYRKFHQVFVHIDRERLSHVRTDFGDDANPFEVHRLSIVSTELLSADDALRRALMVSAPEMVVVDEAHHVLQSSVADILGPVVRGAPNALLLTATPFQMGESGFDRLVKMLDLPHEREGGVHTVGRVSAVTREEVRTLGRRQPVPVVVDESGDLTENDPRVAWLLGELSGWVERGEKSLIFVNDAETAVALSDTLTRVTGKRVYLFHEGMGTKARDIELAQFRISKAPILISSGAGGEGRNFQFCTRMIHLELPADPIVLEQRIGRLDRIGRSQDVPIFYFVPGGPQGRLARAFDRVGIFSDASVGSSPAMVLLRDGLGAGIDSDDALEALLREVTSALAQDAGAWVFPDSHRADGPDVLAHLPEDLDETLQRFCVDAAERIGLDVVEKEGESIYYFEYGTQVEVDSVPGIEEGTRFLGTFDRQTAIDNEALDFFANGHPLVESLLAELEDSQRGRAGAIRLPRKYGGGLHGLYLLLLEGGDRVAEPRLLDIMHAGAPLPPHRRAREAKRLFDSVDLGQQVPEGRVVALMQRGAELASGEGRSAGLVQALLVVVMD